MDIIGMMVNYNCELQFYQEEILPQAIYIKLMLSYISINVYKYCVLQSPSNIYIKSIDVLTYKQHIQMYNTYK